MTKVLPNSGWQEHPLSWVTHGERGQEQGCVAGEVSGLAGSRTDDTSHSGAGARGPGPGTRAGDQGRSRGCAAGLRLRLGPGPAQGLRLAHSIKHKHEDLDSIFRTYIKLSVVVHTCNPSARGRGGGGGDTGNFLVSH